MYLDFTQILQSFHDLCNEDVITFSQKKEIVKKITSCPSYGQGDNGRLQISYAEFCGVLATLEQDFVPRKISKIWEKVNKYFTSSLLIANPAWYFKVK